MKGVLTCLDRSNNSMHVRVFIFSQAPGKGLARREQRQDGLSGEAFWRFAAWSAFCVGSDEAASAVSMRGAPLSPRPRCFAWSVVLLHEMGDDLYLCVVSVLHVR